MNKSWKDIEYEQPNYGDRVIVLIPFGMRVKDDTWTENGFINYEGYVSHWMPIDAPGSYTEIMQRPRGPIQPQKPNEAERVKEHSDWFSDAVVEHCKMMQSIQWTQTKLRLEIK